MKEKLKAWLRPSGKWTDFFLIAALLTYVQAYGGAYLELIAEKWISAPKLFILLTGCSEAVAEFMDMYFNFIGVWVLYFLFCLVFKANRPILKGLAPARRGSVLKGALAGLLLGFGSNGFCILMAVLMGDVHVVYNEFNPGIFLLFFAVILIQSGAEEVMDRSYLYQKLRRRYRHPAVAVVGNGVVFAALHIFNPGVTAGALFSIVEIGVFFGLLVYYYDSLWTAIMMHTAWNFTQNIVFGLPNSGIVSEYSLFRLDAASARDGLFYSVNFGVEGSTGAIVLIAVMTAAVLWLNRGKPEKVDLWKDMEAEAALRAAE